MFQRQHLSDAVGIAPDDPGGIFQDTSALPSRHGLPGLEPAAGSFYCLCNIGRRPISHLADALARRWTDDVNCDTF